MVVMLEGFEGEIFMVRRPGGGVVRVLRLRISGGATTEGVTHYFCACIFFVYFMSYLLPMTRSILSCN